MKIFDNSIVSSFVTGGLLATTSHVTSGPVAEVTCQNDQEDSENISVGLVERFEFELGGVLYLNQHFDVPEYKGVVDLRLKRVPKVVVRDFVNYCIDDWGLSFISPHEDLGKAFESEIVRNFLSYFRKAQDRALCGAERRYWRNLLSDFDADKFFEIDARPVRTIGFLKKKASNYAIIQWTDDPSDYDKVEGMCLQNISFLRENDMFAADVKFVSGKLFSIGHVRPCNG